MVDQMDEEGFGNCTNIGECSSVCPKEIKLDVIAQMNRDLIKASVVNPEAK
jgi:succinate dehydrogenase / fumarate reductase iron-sulfur subunit